MDVTGGVTSGHQLHPDGAVAPAPVVPIPPVEDVVPCEDGVPAHELPLQHEVGTRRGADHNVT